jgi:hypothetical protein
VIKGLCLRRRALQTLIVTLPQPSNNKFVTIGVYLAVAVFTLITVLKLIENPFSRLHQKVRIRKNTIKAYSGGDDLYVIQGQQ